VIEINKNPSRSELKWFGLLLLVFLGVVGAVVNWRFHAPAAARGLWMAGVGLCLVYYALPVLRRPMFIGWMFLAFPIGWTVSHVLLGLTYYLVFTPIGLLIRFLGRDPLHRKFEPDAKSYWVEHDPSGDPSRYFRQY
jgi:ABC-type uncharacterized transport system permease subunit